MLEAEDLDKDAAEEASSVKKEGMSEDMQRMLMKLQTPDAAKVAPPSRRATFDKPRQYPLVFSHS